MKNENFSYSFSVNTSAQKIFDCICNVKSWWAADVKGNTKNLNDEFTVRFGKTYSTFKVTEFVPYNKIVWLVTDTQLPLFANKTEWLNTQIVWEIESSNDSCQLTMTHVGLTPKCECYIDCNKGWSFYVGDSLKNLIIDNKGLPGVGIFSHISDANKRYDGLLYLRTEALPKLTGNYILVDVEKTHGEHVTSAYSIKKLDVKKFNANDLKGEYYMLIEDKPQYENIDSFEDIQIIINKKTKKMENKNYQISINVNADAQKAFENISDVAAWWTPNIFGNTNNLHDEFTVDFGETFVKFKITEFKPYSKIVWLVTDCNIHFTNDKKEWKDTSVEWEIAEKNNSTEITMTHNGLVPAIECYSNCEKGWNFYTGESLRKLIDQGKGLPNTPAKERAEVA